MRRRLDKRVTVFNVTTVFVMIVIAVFIVTSSCGSSAETAPPHPEKQVTTTTIAWPQPVLHTQTKHKIGDIPNMPNSIEYVWHGTIDGRECIIIEDGSNPSITCDWSNQR